MKPIMGAMGRIARTIALFCRRSEVKVAVIRVRVANM